MNVQDVRMNNTYKLYEIPRESKIEVEMDGYPSTITFHRLDGMYSICTTEQNIVVHLYACSELEKLGDNHYKLLG